MPSFPIPIKSFIISMMKTQFTHFFDVLDQMKNKLLESSHFLEM